MATDKDERCETCWFNSFEAGVMMNARTCAGVLKPGERSVMRLLATCLLLTASLARAAEPLPALPIPEGVREHVRGVAASVALHIPRLGERPDVELVAMPAVVAGMSASGQVQISTGLIRALGSDAELAMIVAYEDARTLPAPGPVSSPAPSVGAQVARAVVIGATVGAVSGAVSEALEYENDIVRGIGIGGVAAGTGTWIATTWNRRGTHSLDRSDDDAVADGMRALLGAGYDGHAALQAWTALAAVASSGSNDGSYGDRDANRHRRKVAAKVLKGSQAVPGAIIGRDEYLHEVLTPLAQASVVGTAAPVAQPAPGPSPAPLAQHAQPAPVAQPPSLSTAAPAPVANTHWLSYDRSGGITGWRALVTIDADGTVSAWSSRGGGKRPPETFRLSPDELAAIADSVAIAEKAAARTMNENAGMLRDGQTRIVTIQGQTGSRVLVLSDGFQLLPTDHDLLRLLEGLVPKG